MAVLIDHQSINISNDRTFTITNNLSGSTLICRLARCTTATPTFWPSSSTTLTILVSASPDGGTTWREWAGFSAAGGITYDQGGNEATESRFTCDFPSANYNRVRVFISPSAKLVTELTLEVV